MAKYEVKKHYIAIYLCMVIACFLLMIETSNQRLINDDQNHRCVSHEGEITFDNYLRIDNSNIEPDEVARLIKDTFDL